MHYEINVSLNGKHFFATAERSCGTEDQAVRVYKALRERFPASDGYEVKVTKWECVGHEMRYGPITNCLIPA